MGFFDCDPHTCSECTYLDVTKLRENGYYCEKHYEYVSPCNIECDRFCKAYRRSSEEAKQLRESFANRNNSGCFITTIVCEILNNDDNVKYLQTLRRFRNEVLQKNEEYKNILVNYDLIGPMISKSIKNDEFSYKFADIIFNRAIKPICNLINQNNYDEAIKLYEDMTMQLADFYQVDIPSLDEYEDKINVNLSGHGRLVLK